MDHNKKEDLDDFEERLEKTEESPDSDEERDEADPDLIGAESKEELDKVESEIDEDYSAGEEFGPIKRPPQVNMENNNSRFESSTPTYTLKSQSTDSNKKTLLLLAILALILIGGALFFFRSKNVSNLITSATPSPTPTQTPKPSEVPLTTLNKSDWSFEVLNGSGESGLAKKIGDKVKEAGYEVFKTGNADKSTYATTQIFVKKDLVDKVQLVIADLKDIIKIASYGGELKEGTASARIIIGKDAI